MSHRLKGPQGKDAAAGLLLGLANVPGGLAMGVLAGVSPVSGLYGYLFGTVAGALATSSVLMSVQATAALAVLVSDVPGVDGSPAGLASLVTLTVLTGLIMLVLGLAKTGSVVRFVPHSVVTGFINAVAVTIVLSQVAELTGYRSAESHRVLRVVDTAANVDLVDLTTVVVALVTIALIVLLGRTRLGGFGMVVAIVAVSAVVELAGLDSVRQVADVGRDPVRAAGAPRSQICPWSWGSCFPRSRSRSWGSFKGRRSASRCLTRTVATPTSPVTSAARALPTWCLGSSKGCRSEVRCRRPGS